MPFKDLQYPDIVYENVEKCLTPYAQKRLGSRKGENVIFLLMS